MSKKLNRFSSSINFQSLNRHWSDLLNLIALHLDREGIKEREDGARGVGGAIIGGRRLIEGRLLFEEKRNTFFVLFFCLLLHRLAVRISLPFHIFHMFNCTDPGLQLGDPAPFMVWCCRLVDILYRPKWAKCICVFRLKRLKNPTRWGRTCYQAYIREYPPPPPRAEKAQPASPFFLVFTRLLDSRKVARTRSRENGTLVQVEQATILWRYCYAQGRVLSTTYRTNPPSYADSETGILPVE